MDVLENDALVWRKLSQALADDSRKARNGYVDFLRHLVERVAESDREKLSEAQMALVLLKALGLGVDVPACLITAKVVSTTDSAQNVSRVAMGVYKDCVVPFQSAQQIQIFSAMADHMIEMNTQSCFNEAVRLRRMFGLTDQ